MSSQKRQKNLESWPDAGTCTVWRFGRFTVDAREGRLVRDGQPVAITPKAFDALVVLLTRRGQLVTRQQLFDELWPDTYVSDANLTGAIWMVRCALRGSDGWIETVPKRGYRFVGNASETTRLDDAGKHVMSRPAQRTSGRINCVWKAGTSVTCGRRAFPSRAASALSARFASIPNMRRRTSVSPCTTESVPPWAYCIRSRPGACSKWRSQPPASRRDAGGKLQRAAATHLYLHRNWEKAERAFEQALESIPKTPRREIITASRWPCSLASMRPSPRSSRALELDPLSVRFQWNLATVFYQSARYVDAIEHCGRTLALDVTYPPAYALIGDAYEQKGELALALRNWRLARGGARHVDSATVEEFWRGQLDGLRNRRRKGAFVPAMEFARAQVRLGDVDSTIEWLGKALHERSRLVLELPVDPLFHRFRGHPRFDAITAALPNGHVCRTPP